MSPDGVSFEYKVFYGLASPQDNLFQASLQWVWWACSPLVWVWVLLPTYIDEHSGKSSCLKKTRLFTCSSKIWQKACKILKLCKKLQ